MQQIDAETAEDFSYESSIDKDAYNLVKLSIDDKESGEHREVYAPRTPTEYLNSENRKRWGVLQYYEEVNGKSKQTPEERADKLLALHNRVRRSLTIKNAFGDIRVRAGTMLYVSLNLDDIVFTKEVIVERVKHKFSNNLHLMDLAVKGDFITE